MMKKMNDLTELKHIFVSSQTKLFAALAIITFMIAGSLHAQVQNDNLAASIDDLDKLIGCSAAEVKSKAISDNTFPTDDKSKIFFLYNVKTGLLLNAGGYWGTHVSLKEFGMPLWIHKDKDEYIHFAQKFDKSGATSEEGNYLEYQYSSTTSNKEFDNGVYIDRSYLSGSTIVKRGWALEAVSGKTNIYKLYTYLYSGSSFNTQTKYYLIAYTAQGDVDKNCGAAAETSDDYKTAKSDVSDEWKIITYKQIFELQENQSQTLTKSLDLTFRLQCPGFSRENGALSNWKTIKYGGEGNLRFGLEHYYKTPDGNGNIKSSYEDDFSTTSKNNHISSYTFPDGTDARTFTEAQDYERHCGKYFAADIKKAHGAIYQDITVTHGGAYVIECKGFSTTTKAKLFALVVVKKETGTDGKETVVNLPNSLHMTILGQTNYMSNDEKTALHISEQNMDYAAKEFYGNHKYISSVLVQVPEKGGTIRFGIEVGDHNEKETGKGNYEDNEWTVFDDFRLLYASKTTDGDLVLDEDRDNLDYLTSCSNTYQHVTLHLNKSFTKDKWNGFILPVDLTRDQLTQAFGPNVRLAELHQVTDTEIQFKSIKVTNLDNDAVVMKAYIPYIIFPTKHLELEQSPAYTALLSSTGNTEAKDVHITVKKNHIDIPNVSLAIDETSNKNDLSNMNTTNWTTNSCKVVNATTGSPIVSSNNKMTAYGTFARTFAPTAEGTSGSYQITEETNEDFGKWVLNQKSTFIEGRDNLKGCYFFDQGNMYYSATRPRGLRGFSIWFRPTTGNTAAAKTFIDGVCVSWGETTGIDSIIYGDDSFGENASGNGRFARGIYTLQGQFVGSDSSQLVGLPKGIYLVNGKKVAVK